MYQDPNAPDIQPDDTQPTRAITSGNTQRLLGFIALIAAFGLTIASFVVLMSPTPVNVVSLPMTPTPASTTEQILTNATLTPTTEGQIVPVVNTNGVAQPLNSNTQSNLLLTPVGTSLDTPMLIVKSAFDAFTIIPDRPRQTMLDYVIQKGDTVYDIARRFGVSQDSIAWSNDRLALWTLTIGDTIKIPPVDGVYTQVVGNETTARTLADTYNVADPLVIIDSEANDLRKYTPDFPLPSGTWVFIPGGTSATVNWAPAVERVSGGGTGASGSGEQVGFQLSDPGSCGMLSPGLATYWGAPMTAGTYTITQGYTSWHNGVDMASSPGTPVYAANGGTVIFAGRNTWGYGLAVVISHGPYSTLYGHLSILNVSCGQNVSTGQQIGGVGQTGKATGPHLHFEIMDSAGNRSNPLATIGL